MSRIGKRPIPLPPKVAVSIVGQEVTVKGPKGELKRVLPNTVEILQEESNLIVNRANESRPAKQQHGLFRTLVANMVEGVSTGFQRKLEIQGVGYRANLNGSNIVLTVGYSHTVDIIPPEGVSLGVEDATGKKVKEIVGNLAAKIRAVRPPEVYKGKGIRYLGEFVRRKAGKTGKK
ncbi:MAG: 50S ribosomal protein L6 [Pseudanabaena sp. LacPavin_0818_WC45_MAG_42_6]|nr:50S ribosomal protein L6 [Pseudanabaena sp. LacPavin_0818_WC45_MAG_42_6]